MPSRSTISRITAAGAIAALLALPGTALAEYYVPPGNSAANQYTETLPSAGGDSAGKKKKVTPADAIGAANAKKLEQHGPTGKAAAELAAETAPTPVVNVEADDVEATSGGSTGGSNSGSGGGGGNTGGNGSSAGGGANGGGQVEPGPGSDIVPAVSVPTSSGSSGFGSVLGEATGIGDSGALGLWLPIAILAAIGVAITYRVRLHKPAS